MKSVLILNLNSGSLNKQDLLNIDSHQRFVIESMQIQVGNIYILLSPGHGCMTKENKFTCKMLGFFADVIKMHRV